MVQMEFKRVLIGCKMGFDYFKPITDAVRNRF